METIQHRIWAKARAIKQTLAAKIFGLAVFLLLLTIGLAGFLLWEAARMEETVKIVAHLDVPLIVERHNRAARGLLVRAGRA